MANIWDGRILIWEPDRKEYLKTVWQDGWVEYLPNKRGFEVHTIDDRPYLREGRSTYDQRKSFISCNRVGSLGAIEQEGNMFSFRYVQTEIIYGEEHKTLFELKFEGTTRDCQRFSDKIKETCKVKVKKDNHFEDPKSQVWLPPECSSQPSSSKIKCEFKSEIKLEEEEITCLGSGKTEIKLEKDDIIYLGLGSSTSQPKVKTEATKNDEDVLKRFCGVCKIDMPADKWKRHEESAEHKKLHYQQKMRLLSGNRKVVGGKIIEPVRNELLPEEKSAIKELSKKAAARQDKLIKCELFKINQRHMHGKWDEFVDPKAYEKKKEYICDYCRMECSNKDALKVHKKEHKSAGQKRKSANGDGPSTSKPPKKKGVECKFCRMWFNSAEELKKHENLSEYHYKRIKKAVIDYQVANVQKYTHKHYKLAVRKY